MRVFDEVENGEGELEEKVVAEYPTWDEFKQVKGWHKDMRYEL